MHVEFSDWLLNALRASLLLAAFAGFSWALISSRRQAEKASAHVAARLETALGEIRRLSGQIVVLGGAVEALGTQFAQAQVQALTPAPAPRATPSSASVNTRGYETAIRMARSGASVEEIVASCGTTRAEAKLLRRLHECGEPRRADAESQKIA
jgi:type II secretory pathway pseudopilin PulG